MLATGGYLVFTDTLSYISGGDIIWRMGRHLLRSLMGIREAVGESAQSMVNDKGEPYVVRSFAYSLFTLVAGASIWPAGFAILQTAATLWASFALIGPEAITRPGRLVLTFLYLATASTLPWFAVYLMPDLLAAAIVIYAAILVRRFDDLRTWQQIALGAIASFAIIAHYGHVPLAVGLFGFVLIWRGVGRRLTRRVILAGLIPILFSPLANLSASSLVLDTPSTTPLRLPVLLARSIADGPARWYLEEACPDAALVMCEVYGKDIPDIGEFLWGDSGISSLTPEQLEGIRAEESTILLSAFRRYPLEQTESLLGNSARQIVSVGTDQISVATWDEQGDLIFAEPGAQGLRIVEAFDPVTVVGTWAAAAVILLLWAMGRLGRHELELLAIVVVGLLINAAIFGGLSAPVDRYQSRVIWLIPALAGLFLTTSNRVRQLHKSGATLRGRRSDDLTEWPRVQDR
ncbi:hypothetical protein Rumeso_02393 [Rubellimicrobium mesophilum DSM 19309]|uniref:Glycosyltransferase RgtA/B/C/D-like domain-containing protein n=2 Tax=Rubellimicrobium TaxID=295418 RepID=A0A017HQB8_9RHOB|nr:hypothetical protein Rumeso_02393 [Rubellimicrobium mesophilum DSM 19309]